MCNNVMNLLSIRLSNYGVGTSQNSAVFMTDELIKGQRCSQNSTQDKNRKIPIQYDL